MARRMETSRSSLDRAARPGQQLCHAGHAPEDCYRCGKERITIEINSLQPWGRFLFIDGFESGDSEQWSAIVP